MRVELIGLAVEIEIGAGKIRLEQRRTGIGCRGEELINVTILRTSQGRRLQSRAGEKGLRIVRAAMGGIQNGCRAVTLGRQNDEGRIEEAGGVVHHSRHSWLRCDFPASSPEARLVVNQS